MTQQGKRILIDASMILFLTLQSTPETYAQGCLFSEERGNDIAVLMLQSNARHVHAAQSLKNRSSNRSVGPVFEAEQAPFLNAVQSQQLSLDWFTSDCSAAYDAQDFAAFAMKNAARRALMPEGTYPLHGFSHGIFHTAPGTWATGARICYDAGFLDLSKEALWNFTEMRALSEAKCNELADTVASLEHRSATPVMSETDSGMNQQYVFRKCSIDNHLGKYGLGCAMANCIYSYCFLADGRVGQGKQCNSSWMEPGLVSPHLEAAFGFSSP